MAPSKVSLIAPFIEGAPPGELSDVVTDIKQLTNDDRNLLTSLSPAFKSYNEEQLATVKLPGGNQEVIISPYNALEDGRYYDTENQTSFEFDHVTQKASAPRSHTLESQHEDLM
ncbi:MAG: F-actin-capping protein subunit alpha [Watsoniomyces obsoletus]|nr:MAG: F-actin-capping protein subunit alpha [Watsoniomyces obsoletus]